MVVYNYYFWYKQLFCFVLFPLHLKTMCLIEAIMWWPFIILHGMPDSNNDPKCLSGRRSLSQQLTLPSSLWSYGGAVAVQTPVFFSLCLFHHLGMGLNLPSCSAGMFVYVWWVTGMSTRRSSNKHLSSHAIKLGRSCRNLPGSLQGNLFARAVVLALFSWLRENWFSQKNVWYF